MDLLKHVKYSYSISNLSEYVSLPQSENDIVAFHGPKTPDVLQNFYNEYQSDKISTKNIVLSYDKNSDKISITIVGNIDRNVDIVIRDVNTKLVIFT